MKLMKVFDISEFTEKFQDHFIPIGYPIGYIEVDMEQSIPKFIHDELFEKGCLGEVILLKL